MLINGMLLVTTEESTWLLVSDLTHTQIRDVSHQRAAAPARGRPLGVDFAETCL